MSKKNCFATNSADKFIKIFSSEQFSLKMLEHAIPKKEIFIVSPYLGMHPFVWEHAFKEASIATFHFVKLNLFLNHQHD